MHPYFTSFSKDEKRLALAARTSPKFIDIPREHRGGKVHYAEEQTNGNERRADG
jgi:hypothetical protein